MKEKNLHLRIGFARDNLGRAKARLENVKREVQAECEHKIVAEIPFESYCYTGYSEARRICYSCRLEEEGPHYSWSDNNALCDEDWRIIQIVTRDVFYALRV